MVDVVKGVKVVEVGAIVDVVEGVKVVDVVEVVCDVDVVEGVKVVDVVDVEGVDIRRRLHPVRHSASPDWTLEEELFFRLHLG